VERSVQGRSVAALLATLALCLPGCSANSGEEPTAQEQQAICALGSTVKGIDVSEYQGTVDWPSVKAAGIAFAIARISDGNLHVDPTFAANWPAMQSAGLVRGGYQFFEPGEDPMAQASVVILAVGTLGDGDLPVTADVEVTGGQSPATIVANLQAWVSAVKAGTGKAPLVYTAPGIWDGSVGSAAFGNLPLWVANWGVACPNLPSGWKNWSIWQYSDMGIVNGVPATVDLDEYNGTLQQLQAFAGTGVDYAAQFVGQSWPLATTTMTMNACDTLQANITLANVGKKSWDSNTELATTQPRDRTSPFADTSWLSPTRPAAVMGTVPPGGTYKFVFDFHAPAQPGMYDEFFGVVEQGVAWFSDPGQGGPPDNDIEAKILVVGGDGGACRPTAGADSGGLDAANEPDAEASVDGGVVDASEGGSIEDAGSAQDSAALDGDVEASTEAGGLVGDSGVRAETGRGGGGCGCVVVPSASSGATPGGLVGLLAFVVSMRARARARRRSRSQPHTTKAHARRKGRPAPAAASG
jgi:lysozyme